ncbi:MAG: DNA polymerase I [Gammaproteobacteria bacterium]|nr:MAG: DNA polymerase I [Gammaproteobacteria bacterium]
MTQAASARPPLVLVDGSSYLYRAYHALPPLTTSKGEPTGAVYGVVNMLRKLLREVKPERMAVVFDAPGKTFRDEMFEAYKANRPPMPDELAAQIPPLLEVVQAMGLPLLQVPGVEADDVIGTLAREAAERGEPVLVSTGDKDMAQLVNGRVTLVNTMTDTVLDRDGVIEKFGVPPERIVDWLALVGDASDNIPGVPKVGPKTATKWLRQYGSLDEIVRHADEIRGKVGESLRAHLGQLELSRRLATIRTDLDLPVDPDVLTLRPPDRARLRELFERLEFRTWLRELEDEAAAEAGDPSPSLRNEADYEVVLDEERFRNWLERLAQAECFAFDTETTSLDYMAAEVVGVSFAISPGEAAYVPVGHDYPGAPEQLDRDFVLESLRPLLESDTPRLLGHNLKYDMNVLANHGIHLSGIAYDTMLESYVLNSTAARHDMDTLALKYLDHRTLHYEDVAGKGAKQLPFNAVPLEAAGPYAAEDADVVLRLHAHLWPKLAAEPGLKSVFEEIERPLIPVLSRMERTGVRVDVARLQAQSRELAERMRELEAAAWQLAGARFNLGSPKQIQEILFGRLGLPVLAKTPKGQPSTAESVLAELAEQYELPRLILEWRSLSKLKSTYTDRLPEQVDPRTGRVHTSYHQAVAATGRLSSSDPNLQNIPIRTEEGRRIRRAFVAEPGYRMVAADYSQIELRIMAHLSGDAGLLQAFAEGRDIHRATAAEVFGVPEDQVTPEQRRTAKVINFGLIYGMSPFGLAKQLGIDRGAAQDYVELYFARYPGVKRYMEKTREQARERGYVETLFGRRLYVPEIRARNQQRRAAAERTAINAPMQGTAADIIKRAMIRLHRWIEAEAPEVRMILQVHDELVFEVPGERVDAVISRIRERMESAAELEVPLEVDIGVGDNWDEAH